MNISPIIILNAVVTSSTQKGAIRKAGTTILKAGNTASTAGLKMTNVFSQDEAIIHGTPKTLISRANDIPRSVAKQINATARARQKKVDAFKAELLGDLLVTEYNPSNTIYAIKGRAKSVDSIIEKANTRKWYTKEEILNEMTDLNGAKTILRDGSRPEAHKVLDRYLKAMEEGKIELVEIENKRPIAAKGKKGYEASKYDYEAPELLEDMVKKANAIQKHKVKFKPIDYTDANYTATHFLFRFPGENWVFEEQLVGYDVAVYKDLDDIIWKILNNKNVNKKYKPIIDIIEPLNEIGNSELKNQFNKYRGNVFLFQREKAPHITKHKTERFLPIKDEIDNEVIREKLDMNYLYELMLKCEKRTR